MSDKDLKEANDSPNLVDGTPDDEFFAEFDRLTTKSKDLDGSDNTTPKPQKSTAAVTSLNGKTDQSSFANHESIITKSTKNKHLNTIIAIVMAVVVAVIAAWFLWNQSEDSASQIPKTSQVSDSTLVNTEQVAQDSEASIIGDEVAITDNPQEMIVNPNDILSKQIPEDPALIKEEIDVLKDKNAQLVEQEALIKEQLSTMEELTRAKEEQIALLEAQIALKESE